MAPYALSACENDAQPYLYPRTHVRSYLKRNKPSYIAIDATCQDDSEEAESKVWNAKARAGGPETFLDGAPKFHSPQLTATSNEQDTTYPL